MKKYTIGLLDCEIDVEIPEEELESYKNDKQVLYIHDENNEPIFVNVERIHSAIMEI